jgi:hypothetical protein
MFRSSILVRKCGYVFTKIGGSYKPQCKLFLREFSFILCKNVQFDKTFSYWQTKYDIQQKNLCTLMVQKILLKKDMFFFTN